MTVPGYLEKVNKFIENDTAKSDRATMERPVIHEQDLQFHIPADIGYDWAETGYFNFYIPDRAILGLIYIVHRAGVGATVCDIEIIDSRSSSVLGPVYRNMTNHNPRPASATDFVLPNGLRYRAPTLSNYEIGFEDEGIALSLRCNALMPPFDIHDPLMDPMASTDVQQAVAHSGLGAAYSGHFDMTVRITGELLLRGETLAIDCISTMDHSWGPRPENRIHPVLWLNAHHGPNCSFHAIFSFDRHAPANAQHEFKHGYALIDGEVRGCVGGSVSVTREGLYPLSVEMRLTDKNGHEHGVSGHSVSHHPWMPYGNNLAALALIAWDCPGRSTGHGTWMEGFRLNEVRI